MPVCFGKKVPFLHQEFRFVILLAIYGIYFSTNGATTSTITQQAGLTVITIIRKIRHPQTGSEK
jgi:hypothetical protein